MSNVTEPLLKASRYKGNSKGRNAIVSRLAYLSSALSIATLFFLLTHHDKDDATKETASYFLILWTVLPPVWFWVENHMIWQTANPDERGDFETFKHSQELSRNIWLAFVGILIALYFK
jgi:hypothetical protein